MLQLLHTSGGAGLHVPAMLGDMLSALAAASTRTMCQVYLHMRHAGTFNPGACTVQVQQDTAVACPGHTYPCTAPWQQPSNVVKALNNTVKGNTALWKARCIADKALHQVRYQSIDCAA